MIRHWIVLRHAHAEAQSADGQDFSRELSERGRDEARRAADALAAMLGGRLRVRQRSESELFCVSIELPLAERPA